MNTYQKEIEGLEFDWFAEDLDGNIAMFSTAGSGAVPKCVIENFKLHNHISESMDSPNWGSSEVWSDYAKFGLFVYDWSLYDGPYLLVQKPKNVMANELSFRIKEINELPKIPIKFKSTTSVDVSHNI